MFVLLEHRADASASSPPDAALSEPSGGGVHWDLLVEAPGSPTDEAHDANRRLPTWRLARCPLEDNSAGIPAERIQDHRPLYLEFEGAISGGRGYVRRLDRGPARVERLSGAELIAVFEGTRLRGRFEIVRRDCSPITTAGELVFRPAASNAKA